MLGKFSLALILTASTLVFACGDDDAPGSGGSSGGGTSGSSGSSGTSGSSGSSGSSGTSGTPGTASELDGTWLAPCLPEAAGWHAKAKYTIANGTATWEYRQYQNDPTCSDESKLAVDWIEVSDSWTIGDRSAPPVALDRNVKSATMRMIKSDLKNIWDTQSGCGPHALDVAEDILGKTCWGIYTPAGGGVVYDMIELTGADTFAVGSFAGKTPETRPKKAYAKRTYTREGAVIAGFIEGTVDGQLVRAEKRPTSPFVTDEYVQISAATADLPPWTTWVLQVPRATGTFTCKTAPSPTYINYGFTQNNLPVLWDTEQSGGNDCSITVTKAPTAKGEAIEGTFSGVMGDGNGAAHEVTNGSFKITLTK